MDNHLTVSHRHICHLNRCFFEYKNAGTDSERESHQIISNYLQQYVASFCAALSFYCLKVLSFRIAVLLKNFIEVQLTVEIAFIIG